MKKFISMLISISMIFAMLPSFVIAEGEKSFELSKTEYTKGEKVVITNVTGTENQDWFGVYKADVEKLSWESMVNGIYKYHNSTEGDGTIVLETADLEAGEYLVILLEDNGYSEISRKAFTIVEKAEVPALATYNSSTNFSTSTNDGTWDNGIWRAEYWHPEWYTYVKMSDVHQGGEYTDNMWDWTGAAIRVNGTDIITTNSSNTKSGVRAFIVPYKGTVTIKSSKVTNQSGNGIYVRIIKTNSENGKLESLWGKDWNSNLNASFTAIYGWNEAEQDEIADIAVEKGDVIRFEVVSMDTGSDGKANWTNEIIYTAIEPEAAPEIAIDYVNEKLTGFGEGSYTIDGAAVTHEDGSLAIAEYIGKTISIVKKGVIEAADSEAQSLAIPVRPAAPTASDLTVTHPAVIDGTGSISGVSGMEYKLSSAESWTECTQNEITGLEAGTYDIRKKATDTSFKSDTYSVKIDEFVPSKETTPEISIDYVNEKLTGFGEGSYTIGGEAVTPENGSLDIAAYMDTTITIVKKGNGTTTINSEDQNLQIPARPTAPEVSAGDETSVGANDGKITGVTDAMEYKLSSVQEWTSVDSGVTELTNLAPGSYNVRYKATASSFVSLSETVAINAKGVQEPTVTVPTLADTTYTDGMKLLDISLAGIQIPSGNTPGAFTWKTPNMLVNAGDNQSFDAVFTPTDTTNFKIKDLQIPVNIKPAAITGITVTGYEGNADGQPHGVTVSGTRAGDTVTYKVDSDEFTADVPSYTEVCEHTVTVKVARANYTDFVSAEVKVKITSAPTASPTASPVPVPTPNPDRMVFGSNDAFSTDSGNGAWDYVWSAMMCDENGDYQMITDKITVSPEKNDVSGGYGHSDDTGYYPIVNGHQLVDPNLPIETVDKEHSRSPVRVFTAPKAGTVTIASAEIQDHSGQNKTARIIKQTTGGNSVLWENDIAGWSSISNPALTFETAAGDKIYFEVKRKGTNNWNYGNVSWTTTVTYTDPDATPSPSAEPTTNPTSEPTAAPSAQPTSEPTQTTYISNEKFNTSTADGKWDGGIWSAMCYVQDWWSYSSLTDVTDGKYNLGWLENGLARVDGSTLETDTITDNFTARAFTVPKDGIIRIEKTEITNKSASASKFQIRSKPNDSTDLNTLLRSSEIEANGKAEQAAIELSVKAGDIIYFEAATASAGTGVTVEWINTLKYIDEFTPVPTPSPTPKPTPEPPLEEGTYKSSHNFIPEDGSGVWESVWSAEIYNSADRTYTDAKTEYSGGYAENNTDAKQPVVYGNKMKVTGEDTPNKHPVRKFTVPKDGKLRILESEITHKTWEEVQYNIKLNDTVIWTEAYSDSSVKLIQPEQRLQDVKEGDVIRFEAILKEGTSYGYEQLWENTILYWDGTEPTPTPIPTPMPDPDFNKTLYRASDSWSMEENGDNVWKWQSYNVTSKTYEDLTKTMESNLSMGDDWSDGPVWIAGDDWRWTAVGKYTMRATVDPGDPTTEETSGDFKVHRDYPVRTFTSPKNGTVSIQAPDNKILAKDETTGTHIRIMCQRADGSKPIQIFPNAEETDWLNIKGEYNFEPIEFELNAGDKLMFENAFIWKEGGYSPWNTYVQWDPIVEYKTISPKLTGVIPADGAENIALNAEHILNYDGALADISADKLTVYEVNSEGENIKSDAVCSSIAVDGSSVKFVLDGLKPYTKYEAKLDGICYFGFDAKNEKSETITFTTGPAVNIGEAKYENGKVSVPVNNPYKENKTATLIAAVCKGTESKYSIEKTYYITRRDIGANDVIETEAELPSGSDYFIKAVVMEDMQKARAYAAASIIRR